MEFPVIAIITARGGSQRLPRKNVKEFCGIPLVAWSIVQAKCSKHIDYVYVSTDDDEIETISKQYGAEVIRRPDWPDANEAAANRPMLHAMDVLSEKFGYDYTLVSILPTSPCRFEYDMDKCIEKFNSLGVHSVLPMTRRRETFLYKKTHPYIVRFVIGDKACKYWEYAGGFNVCTAKWYKKFVGEMDTDLDKVIDAKMQNPTEDYEQVDTFFHEVELFQTAEVDTLHEFEIAEILMDKFILNGRGLSIYYDYAKLNKKEV